MLDKGTQKSCEFPSTFSYSFSHECLYCMPRDLLQLYDKDSNMQYSRIHKGIV